MFQALGPYAFENQPIALVILTQPTRYKRAESNLLADKKGPQQETVVLKQFYQFIHSWRKAKDSSHRYIEKDVQSANNKIINAINTKEKRVFIFLITPARKGTLGCLLIKFPKFYNNVFLFVGLTTLGTLIEFWLVSSLSWVYKNFNS